jgi:EmrB/QacA subfamily drug resistance transporter
MAPLDSSIVHTTLPLIAREFRVDVLRIEWVVLAYLLTLSSLLLIGGRLGDRLGERPLFVGGFALFTVGSLFCGLAQGVGTLIVSRVAQAAGGSLLIALGPAMLTRAFPASQRGRVLGVQASVVYLGLTIGPGLGGLIASSFGWRWVFLVNLPIGLAAIGTALVVLHDGPGRTRRDPFDLAGACLFAAGLVAFVFAISRGAEIGWNAAAPRIAALSAATAAAAFVARALRHPHPFLDLRLFRHRLFAAATLSALCNYMASATTAFLTPFYLIRGNHLTPDRAGALLMTMPLTMALVAPLSGWLSDRIGSRLPTVAGMICVAAGMWMLGGSGPAPREAEVALRLAVVGLGVGLFTSPNNSAIMGAVPQALQGLASGLVATARTLGMILGVTVSGALFGAGIQRLLPGTGQDAVAVVQAYGYAMRIVAAVAAAGALASLVRGRRNAA